MKRLFLCLLVLSMLLSNPCALALDASFYGEWIDYASLFFHPDVQDSVLTIADSFAYNGHLDDGFIIHEDGTVDIRTEGEIIDTGVWTETDEGHLFEEEGYGKTQTIQITDSSGAQLFCAFMKNWMFSTASWGDYEMIDVHYKRDLYQLQPNDVQGDAWEMSYVFLEGYNGDSLGGKYDYVDPARLQMDCRINLNEDMTADLLVDYVPQKGKWHTEGLTLYIESDSGAELMLEEQYDHSLFGTYRRAPGDELLYVEFDPVDALNFHEPISADLFEGVWRLSGLHNAAGFYAPAEDLTFTQTIEISGGKAIHSQDGANGSYSMEFGVEVVGGPSLDDNQTGAILLLVRGDGVKLPLWLLEDNSLYLRVPGSTCYYYTRE